MNQATDTRQRISFELLISLGFVPEDLGEDPTAEEMTFRRMRRESAFFGTFEVELSRNWDTFTLPFIVGRQREYKYLDELQDVYSLITGEVLDPVTSPQG
jgi:hypothetical protein